MLLFLTAGLAPADDAVTAGDIRVAGAWARATPPGVEIGAAYFVIENRGAPDRLVAVTSPMAARAEMHRSSMRDGLMRMERQTSVPVAGGGTTEFAPGALHVMLHGLRHPLAPGASFPLTLTFEHAGTVAVDVAVRAPGNHGQGHAHDHAHGDHRHHGGDGHAPAHGMHGEN